MKKEFNETFERDVLKADLILSDITLATDPEEKRVLTDLLDRYVMRLEDPAVTEIFNKMTGVTNSDEIDIYTEILVDILADRKAGIMARCE